MKHILCFGDSNTHGFIPFGGRYDDDTRYTGHLAKMLGPDYKIIEEGMNGRTSSLDDPMEPYRNALDYIIPCLKTHNPLDLTLVMLGSNDMKQRFNPTAEKVADGLRRLTKIILEYTETPVLLVSPILLAENIAALIPSDFSEQSVAVSRQLGTAVQNVAQELGTYYLNAADFAAPSAEDGLHLTPEGHRQLAEAFYSKIKEILH